MGSIVIRVGENKKQRNRYEPGNTGSKGTGMNQETGSTVKGMNQETGNTGTGMKQEVQEKGQEPSEQRQDSPSSVPIYPC